MCPFASVALIVALLADLSGSIFAFLQIIADSCCLLSSLPLAYTPFLLAACLYVTQTTALRNSNSKTKKKNTHVLEI